MNNGIGLYEAMLDVSISDDLFEHTVEMARLARKRIREARDGKPLGRPRGSRNKKPGPILPDTPEVQEECR